MVLLDGAQQLDAFVAEGGLRVVRDEVLANGRLEFRHYLREQSVSETVHRYGNVRGG